MKIEWTECDFINSRSFVESFNFDFPFNEEKYVIMKMIDRDNTKIYIKSGRIIRMANCYNIIIDGNFGHDYAWMNIIAYCFLEA